MAETSWWLPGLALWVIAAATLSCGARSDVGLTASLLVDEDSGPREDATVPEDASGAGPRDAGNREGEGGGVDSCANCGACSVACTAGMTCLNGNCVCPPGAHDCGGACESDLSVESCGTLCTPCPSPPNSNDVTCDGVACGLICTQGFTLCGAACADLQTDSRNCGACMHDCLGGACDAGVCQPVVLVSGQPDLLFLAVNATNLYWTTDPAAVVTMPIDGASATTLVSGGGPLEGIAVDATSIYWSTYVDDTLMKMPLAGGLPTTFASGLARPLGVAVDAFNLYFSDTSGDVLEIPLAGGSPVTLTPTPAGFATGVAVNASSIYWSSGGALNVMPLAGGASTDLVDGQDDAFGVAVDATNVYWTTLYGGLVLKMPLGGGSVTTLISGLSTYASGIAVDDVSLYWGATTANEVGSIMRLAK